MGCHLPVTPTLHPHHSPGPPGTHTTGPASFGVPSSLRGPSSGHRQGPGSSLSGCLSWRARSGGTCLPAPPPHQHPSRPSSPPARDGVLGCRGAVPPVPFPRRGHQQAGKSQHIPRRGSATCGLHTSGPQVWERGHGEVRRCWANPNGTGTGSRVLGCRVGGHREQGLNGQWRPGPAAGLCQGLRGRVPATASPAAWVPLAHAIREAVEREPCPGPWVTRPHRGAVLGPRCRFHQPLPLTVSLTLCWLHWTFLALASRLFPGCGCSVRRV